MKKKDLSRWGLIISNRNRLPLYRFDNTTPADEQKKTITNHNTRHLMKQKRSIMKLCDLRVTFSWAVFDDDVPLLVFIHRRRPKLKSFGLKESLTLLITDQRFSHRRSSIYAPCEIQFITTNKLPPARKISFCFLVSNDRYLYIFNYNILVTTYEFIYTGHSNKFCSHLTSVNISTKEEKNWSNMGSWTTGVWGVREQGKRTSSVNALHDEWTKSVPCAFPW